jgi:hypothetical protein
VFYGCFDWHSAVHGHWLLARVLSLFPGTGLAEQCRATLGQSLRPEAIAGEVEDLAARPGFERPYGLAWLLQLAAELRASAPELGAALEPLESLAAAHLAEWIPKLRHPIRSGEHSQSAFAFGLALDWAREVGSPEYARLLEQRSLELYHGDRNGPVLYEPSGQDFLSPCLAEADLLRRVLAPEPFAAWLGSFLPQLPEDGSGGWLEPVVSPDPADGKLAHLDGLNQSRAWMLQGMAAGLPEGDRRRTGLLASAASHAEAGLASVSSEHYEGSHWLGSFAL